MRNPFWFATTSVPGKPRPVQLRRGAALIIVLAFVVLLTGLMVAFFSRALSNRQISNSSASQTKVDAFAQGAMLQIVGDLKQEIADPSRSNTTSITTTTGTGTIYTPKSAAYAVPQLVGSSGTGGAENLVKISRSGSVFYSGGTCRASAISTTGTSLNGRYLSPARWNKARLLPVTSGTDATPQFTGSTFVAPDWILMARDGSNPTPDPGGSIPSALKWSSTASSAVVGRYAYAIYNEGGLLDANVAGYPSVLSSSDASRKEAVSFADLTQVFIQAGLPLNKAQQAVDAIVGWRNSATAQVSGSFPNPNFSATSGSNYANAVRNNTTGFLMVSSTNGVTDRAFYSRQQLISFFSDLGSGLGFSADEQNALQSALQYFTHFSRCLAQPSYRPDPNRPRIVGNAYQPSTTYTGGNDAWSADHSLENAINPAFATIRVTETFARNDGSTAQMGEPLVKKRFALNRLCWLTCEGPSKDATAAVRKAYTDLGVSSAQLDQGTAQNIEKYFGLRWTDGPGANKRGGYWTYLRSDFSTLDSLCNTREPDFFELLRAGICAGSLAKAGPCVGKTPETYPLADFQRSSDTILNNQLYQIGANIIAQASPDNFPIRIIYTDPNTGPISFFGVTDLPYLYGLSCASIVVTKPTFPTGTVPSANGYVAPYPNQPPFVPGLGAAMLFPVIWNPHSPSSSVGLSPSQLRVSISNYSISSLPSSTSASASTSFTPQYYVTGPPGIRVSSTVLTPTWPTGSHDSTTGCIQMPTSGITNGLTFSNDPTFYREPTPLYRPGIPTGLALEPNSYLASDFPAWSTGIPTTSGTYIGFYAGQFPLQWTTNGTTYTANNISTTNGLNTGVTVSLEYDSGGTWIPYSQRIVLPLGDPAIKYSTSYPLILASVFRVFMDPRSQRWGASGLGCPPLDFASASSLYLDSAKTLRPSIRSGTDPRAPFGSTNPYYFGSTSQSMYFPRLDFTPYVNADNYFYDPDKVVRRAMGGHVPDDKGTASTMVGLPMAAVYGNPGNVSNRPIILHRPFRSVGELGYVFSDMPWRSIDFSTAESGFAALLDLFCIREETRPDALLAGRVDLNTRQKPVLQALLSGAYMDELLLAGGASALSDPLMSGSFATVVSGSLVARTTSTDSKKGPLLNIADLVGRYVSSTANDSSQGAFDGFSNDLGIDSTALSPVNMISRFRETSIRALSSTGMTGCWNLMVDLVAQTGRYPMNANLSGDFLVEGEKRYWLHLAIDRQTGEIIDQQIEQVNE